MGMFTNIFLDANLDIRELALHLLPEMPTSEEIILRRPGSQGLQYHFLAEGGRPLVYLSENDHVYLNQRDVSIYRYELSAIRGPQLIYMQTAYEHLRNHLCFPLAYEKLEGLADSFYQPVDYIPDYSLITRLMPVELLIWTHLKKRALLKELRKYTGRDFSGDTLYEDCSSTATHKTCCYLERIDKITLYSPSRYSETGASYYIRIFGNDDHPVRRRVERDAFAREVLAVLRDKASMSVKAFEVIGCEFEPFI